jgi:hypothetical protein
VVGFVITELLVLLLLLLLSILLICLLCLNVTLFYCFPSWDEKVDVDYLQKYATSVWMIFCKIEKKRIVLMRKVFASVNFMAITN